VARVPQVVVDASVACKWYLPEVGAEAAVSLRDAHINARIRLYAPALITYEVANALRHHPDMTPSLLRASVRRFFDLQVALVPPSDSGLSRAADIAIDKGLTIYDASYLALAVDRACPLVTDDAHLLRASDQAVAPAEWSQRH
jgi:predicted nucleic acid-binding protein